MDAIELTRKLIQIESTNPGAGEQEIGDFIRRLLEEHHVQTEHFPVQGKREIVKGVIPGRQQHPALVFICHMDTVAEGSGWSKDAFGAEVSEGRIWGRGACDMKSGTACALSVFLELADRVHQGKEHPEHSLVFIGTVDEEGDMTGAEAAVSNGWITSEDWVLDMEPTSGMIQMAHKGRTWFRMEVDGITAHASMPEKGADAIAGCAELITRVRKKIQDAPVHEELGRSTVTFGQIQGGYSPYVVSDHCVVMVDMRLVPPLNTQKAEQIVMAAAEETEAEVPGVTVSYTVTGDRPPLETHPESELMKALRASVEKVTGKGAVVSVFTGYTDTAVVAGLTGNPNCMSYGPGNLAQAHKPDEYVRTADIVRCKAVYRDLVLRLTGASSI